MDKLKFTRMKRIVTISLILFCIAAKPISNKQKKEAKLKLQHWSSDQGAMTWYEAKAKCASLKMRLPTRVEWIKAYNAKVFDGWNNILDKPEYHVYWTSEEPSHAYAYYSTVHGTIEPIGKNDGSHVRCIR
jgi:formylglycine-generating enzyme required for sulfatase activity